MTKHSQSSLSETLFAGAGEMCALMKSHDWTQTPLGSIEHWPQSLRSAISILLPSKAQICLFWGPEFVALYNDAYRPVFGSKHPHVLGTPGRECWSEIWTDVLGPLLRNVVTTGESFWANDYPFLLVRNGYLEETYFDISYDPVRDESGQVGGVFCIVNETTDRVLGERRLRTLRELTTNTATVKDTEEACHIAIQTLACNPPDIPFALLYQVKTAETQAQLVEAVGIEVGSPASPLDIDLAQANDPWLLAQVHQTGETAIVKGLNPQLSFLCSSWSDIPNTAVVIPLPSSLPNPPSREFLIMGVSAQRAFDDAYRGFFDLVASNITTAIFNARAYEAERQRAEALAEIDRAKTVFFSNISHEFRTPLTLILAPLEDALASLGEEAAWETGSSSAHPPHPPIPPSTPRFLKEQLQLAQRNSLRLLKLVNTLLDFSRIEAGRIQANYEPTDLAQLTAEIASTFRSLIERAGLSFVVECDPLPEAIYVDQEMWEKIVLNLISNAFKFTFTGEIRVSLRESGRAGEWESGTNTPHTLTPSHPHIILEVHDTGIGIPQDEILHLFERFHRVKGAQGRSFEGSGIGLSLVQELVRLHGGSITATSVLGQGSCFTVSIPTGSMHLPQDCVNATPSLASTAMGAAPYIEEASRWLRQEGGGRVSKWDDRVDIPPFPLYSSTPPPKILLADDNADMRDYVKRLLEQQYTVEAVEDGIAALNIVRSHIPDLVLTDVMMPRLDGFGLLQELRADPRTRELPIILLSARAGEESRIEGLKAGADDYLSKPFSHRELLARVEACLKLAQIRREATLREQSLRLAAEQAQRETEATHHRLTQLLETTSDAFVELDKDWRIIYQNAAAERINHGKPRSQVLGKTHWEEWPNSVGSELEFQYRKAMAEQLPVHFEHHYYHPPAFDIWLEIDAYPAQESLGIFFRDITNRKHLEIELQERERLFFTLAEASPVAIFRFDKASNCVYVNNRWSELTGRSVEVALGKGWVETLHPDDCDRLAREWLQWSQNAQERGLYQNEGRCLRPDGSVVWFYIQSLAEVDSSGETVGYIGVLTDITKLKQAEAVLQETQHQLQQQLAEIEVIYQSAPIGLNVLDTDLRFVRINQRLAEINGLSVEAHLGRTIREVLPNLADAAEQLLRPILDTGEPLLNVEITGETPAQPGVQRTWLEHFLPLKNGDRIIGINTVCEEITERKRLEAERKQAIEQLSQAKQELEIRVAERTAELRQINAELQQSESVLRSFFNSGGMLMAIVELNDNNLQFVSANEAMAEFLGATPETLQNRLIRDIDGVQKALLPLLEYCQEAQLSQAPVKFEYCYDQGDPHWLFISICPIMVSSSGLPRFSFIAKDITDRKQAEEALTDHEEQLRLTLEFTHIGTWDWNMKTEEVIWNDNHFRLLGLEPKPTSELYQLWRNTIHPGDVERVEQALFNALAQHIDYETEYRVIYPDGTLHWLIGKGRGIYDEIGEPLRMLGVILDVSDRKRIEEALQVSETRYRGIVQDQTELIARFAPDSTILFVNDAYCRYFGIELDDILGKSYAPVIYEADQKRVAQLVQTMSAENPTLIIENRVIDSQGRIRWTQWVNRMLFDPQGKMLELQSVGRDITELKQVEQALRSSEERLQLALEASGDGIWDWNIATNEIYYSPQYFQMLGYAAEELPHTVNTWYQLVNPEDLVWVRDLLAKHLQDSSVRYEFDYRLRTKAGNWKWIADYGKVVARDEQGHPVRMLGTHRDVSDRKQAEEHIAASLREKEVLLKEIHHRVKNNLGIVNGLLQMQYRRTQDPQAKAILRDSQNRIASIALVHEKLYRSDDLANINFAQYLQDLTIYLFDAYNISSNQITLDIQVEQVNLEIETAIPCGLIVNELVSNALKHAFPDNLTGTIQVRLEQSGDLGSEGQPHDPFTLIVRDNGIGLPKGFDPEKTTTLGISLIQGLVAQIRGVIEINSGQGTEVKVTFS